MTQIDDIQKAALCSAIKSSRYAKKIVALLRDISADLYKTDKPHGISSLENYVEEDLLQVFRQIMHGIEETDTILFEERLKAVIDYLKEVDEISFTVPVRPNAEFLKRLHSWCSDNVHPQILLDFTTNRLMESGLLMVYRGRYFTYSLENLLDDYFSAKDLSTYFNKAN